MVISRGMTGLKKIVKSIFRIFGLDIRLLTNISKDDGNTYSNIIKERWSSINRYCPNTIIDIGANEGQSLKLFREMHPNCRVYSFEPIEDCFQKLNSIFVANDQLGCAFNVALGNANQTMQLHRSEFAPSSSLLPMGMLHKIEMPQTARTWLEDVQVRRLDDLKGEMDLQDPIVIKVDVQGYEGSVLDGGIETFKRAVAVVMEFSSEELYDNQSTFREVYDKMQLIGFELSGFIDQLHSPRDGRILQFDALFEKREREN